MIEFSSFEEARERSGLRLVVVPGVPSPWGEAAKGILHVKQIPWLAVRLDQGSQELADWTGERSGPVAMYGNDAPRSGWAEIVGTLSGDDTIFVATHNAADQRGLVAKLRAQFND